MKWSACTNTKLRTSPVNGVCIMKNIKLNSSSKYKNNKFKIKYLKAKKNDIILFCFKIFNLKLIIFIFRRRIQLNIFHNTNSIHRGSSKFSVRASTPLHIRTSRILVLRKTDTYILSIIFLSIDIITDIE